MRQLINAFSVAALFAASACLVPDVSLQGKACGFDDAGASHACDDGFQCAPGLDVCVPEGFDAGPFDAGISRDAGFPDSGATLVGPSAFTVGGVSRTQNPADMLMSLYVAAPPFSCQNPRQSTSLLEIDLISSNSKIQPGTYFTGLDGGAVNNGDAGIQVAVSFTNSRIDGGASYGTGAGPDKQIFGSLTLTQVTGDFAAGSFSFQLGLTDGGGGPLSGTFTANDVCP
jgi:hypothetical protein